LDASGNVFVADSKNNRIQIFDSNGTFLTKFGSFGSENGEFSLYCSPYDVAVDGSGSVFVSNSGKQRIQKFSNRLLQPCCDTDADGKSDITVWRLNTGVWYTLPSNSPRTYTATQWGVTSDIPVPADYDSDGRADIAVWRPDDGVWYILPSNSPGTYTANNWGTVGDEAISGLTQILSRVSWHGSEKRC
jgi:hypothetical protein